VAVRYFALVLVALLTAAGGALADPADPAVAAMLREWSLSVPSPSSVVICHGFGCAFRTEIGLTRADHAQMAAIMASGSASAQDELWTVDPWTHKGSEVPDIFPLAKWKEGD
jgi:hypothetical protein